MLLKESLLLLEEEFMRKLPILMPDFLIDQEFMPLFLPVRLMGVVSPLENFQTEDQPIKIY